MAIKVSSDAQPDGNEPCGNSTKPGQNRIHMRNDARKRQLADAVGRVPVTAWVYGKSGCHRRIAPLVAKEVAGRDCPHTRP